MYGKIVKIKSLFCSARWKITPLRIKTDLICTRACVPVDLIGVLVYPVKKYFCANCVTDAKVLRIFNVRKARPNKKGRNYERKIQKIS